MPEEYILTKEHRERREAEYEAAKAKLAAEAAENALLEEQLSYNIKDDPSAEFLEGLDPATQHLIANVRDGYHKLTLFEKHAKQREVKAAITRNHERGKAERQEALVLQWQADHPVEAAANTEARDLATRWSSMTNYERLQKLGAAGISEALTGEYVPGKEDRVALLSREQKIAALELLGRAREVKDGPGRSASATASTRWSRSTRGRTRCPGWRMAARCRASRTRRVALPDEACVGNEPPGERMLRLLLAAAAPGVPGARPVRPCERN